MASGERAETTQRWDPRERALISETQHPLEAGLSEASILLRAGRISVEGVKDGASRLVTRLIVSAASEDDARKHLETWQDKLKVQAASGRLTVDGRDEAQPGMGGINISGGRGSVVIGGSFVGGIISTGGGEVWINGQRVDTSRGAVNVPGVEREVVLSVPESDSLRYRLQMDAGSVELNNTQGEARVNGQSAELRVSGFKGALDVDNQSGRISLDNMEGELAVGAQSGDVDAESFRGKATVSTQSGDVRFNRATFANGRSTLKTMSGDVRVGVLNESLRVSASTMSGDIRTPRTGDFTTDNDERSSGRGRGFGSSVVIGNVRGMSINIGGGRGGNQTVEGHFGNQPGNDSLDLRTMSGDITISR